MAEVTIHGMAQSTYVRTCCMVCEEKGIDYERQDAAPHSPELLRFNPTGKMPGFQSVTLPQDETDLGGNRRSDTDAVTEYQTPPVSETIH